MNHVEEETKYLVKLLDDYFRASNALHTASKAKRSDPEYQANLKDASAAYHQVRHEVQRVRSKVRLLLDGPVAEEKKVSLFSRLFGGAA